METGQNFILIFFLLLQIYQIVSPVRVCIALNVATVFFLFNYDSVQQKTEPNVKQYLT